MLQIIKDLGFVQLDSIQNVTRAHHHILWSRHSDYKEYMLDELLANKGSIFEHFTHDASVLPVEFYSVWKVQFQNIKNKIDKSKYYKDILDIDSRQNIINTLNQKGALSIKEFEDTTANKQPMWSKSVHKTTLDYMWYCGVLSTAYRQSFRKYYDLSTSIIPEDILSQEIGKDEQIDWLCKGALHRMSVASAKEIKNFWDALNTQEVNAWVKENEEDLIEVQWENNEGKYIKSFASLDIENRLNNLKPSTQMQIINPFDPTIRDRIRLKKIFDFDYKIEIFVPKAKRIWGYYIYPILEGNKFVGRIELQADRKAKMMYVLNFWTEEGIIWGKEQQTKLDKELANLALLIDIRNIKWLT